jgi:3-oxoadipate enol-lactonase
MPHVSVNGQRVYYVESRGAGLPVVLGHGFLMDHEMFASQVAALGTRYRVITWDQRGHGLTESTPDNFSYWDSADDLRGVLDSLGIERAVVGGMSQGGFVSLRFALSNPDRVAGLVLIDSQAGLEDPEQLPQYEMMTEVWATEGPSDTIADMTAAIIIGTDRPESAPWKAKWKARPHESVRQIFRTLRLATMSPTGWVRSPHQSWSSMGRTISRSIYRGPKPWWPGCQAPGLWSWCPGPAMPQTSLTRSR